MSNKPLFNMRIEEAEGKRLVTVTWTNVPGYPEWAKLYSSHKVYTNSNEELLRKATQCVLDMLARKYSKAQHEEGPNYEYSWRGVYYTMQHHIKQQLKSLIKEHYDEQG